MRDKVYSAGTAVIWPGIGRNVRAWMAGGKRAAFVAVNIFRDPRFALLNVLSRSTRPPPPRLCPARALFQPGLRSPGTFFSHRDHPVLPVRATWTSPVYRFVFYEPRRGHLLPRLIFIFFFHRQWRLRRKESPPRVILRTG